MQESGYNPALCRTHISHQSLRMKTAIIDGQVVVLTGAGIKKACMMCLTVSVADDSGRSTRSMKLEQSRTSCFVACLHSIMSDSSFAATSPIRLAAT